MTQNSFDKAVVESIVGSGTPKANIVRDRKKVEPVTANEEEDKDIKRTIKIQMASQSWTVMEDGVLTSPSGTDLNIVNKNTGIGMIVRANGDILFNAGAKESGKACGGRILVNARGGQLIKTGPVIAEYTSDEKSSTEKGSSTSTKSDTNKIAKSETYWGKVVHEGHGDYRIRARSITIDAQDVLTLLGKEKIVLQAGPSGGGEIAMRCGKRTVETNVNDEWVKSQDMRITNEETNMQFDPRGSVNTVTAGHLNHKVLGDWKFQAMGVGRMLFTGGTMSVPLVKDMRTSALNIHCVKGNLSMMTNIGSMMYSSGNGPSWPKLGLKPGSVSLKAKTDIKQEALLNYEAKATAGKMDLEALGVATLKAIGGLTLEGTGDVDLKSEGLVRVSGTLIKLN